MSSLSSSTCNVCGSGEAPQAGQQVATLAASQTSQKISSWEAIKIWRMPVVSATHMAHIEQLCVCFWSKDGGSWFPPWPAPPRRLPAAPRRPESWAPGATSTTWNLIINLIFLCTTQRFFYLLNISYLHPRPPVSKEKILITYLVHFCFEKTSSLLLLSEEVALSHYFLFLINMLTILTL